MGLAACLLAGCSEGNQALVLQPPAPLDGLVWNATSVSGGLLHLAYRVDLDAAYEVTVAGNFSYMGQEPSFAVHLQGYSSSPLELPRPAGIAGFGVWGERGRLSYGASIAGQGFQDSTPLVHHVLEQALPGPQPGRSFISHRGPDVDEIFMRGIVDPGWNETWSHMFVIDTEPASDSRLRVQVSGTQALLRWQPAATTFQATLDEFQSSAWVQAGSSAVQYDGTYSLMVPGDGNWTFVAFQPRAARASYQAPGEAWQGVGEAFTVARMVAGNASWSFRIEDSARPESSSFPVVFGFRIP